MPEVLEGATRLFPPAGNLAKTTRQPGTKEKGQPFYNPGMDLNRDLSVLLVEAEARRRSREIDVADVLAGTGARALRIAHEVTAPLVVHANDADPIAFAAIQQGQAANAIPAARLQSRHGDGLALLASRRFDVVDIDPYGSPMPFLDGAVRATRHDGLVCITATDTGALAGKFLRACRRRYDAHHGLHAQPWRAEVGLRILAGCVVRSAGRFDRVATPVLSVSHGHWMRVVARIEDGRKDADLALRAVTYAVAEPATGAGRFVTAAPSEGTAWAGPLWSGPLQDAATVAGMQAALPGKSLACSDEVAVLLERLAAETAAPAFWIEPDLLQKRFGPPSPRRDEFIARLRAAGHRAERTHLEPQGIRTDADEAVLRACWHGPGHSR